jgi:Enolase C-terminal domain-like
VVDRARGLGDLAARLPRADGRGPLAGPLVPLVARLHLSPVSQARDSVPVYGSGGFTSYDEHQTREQLAGWVENDRIPRVKIKIGESWGTSERRDLERVALARDVIGPDTELYVDANGGYTAGQAMRVGHRVAEYGVSWLEEPVSSQDLAGLAAVRRQVLPDVAAGEYSWSLADSARLIDAGAVPNLRHVEYFHDHQRIEQMLFDGALDPGNGVMSTPRTPRRRTRPRSARRSGLHRARPG